MFSLNIKKGSLLVPFKINLSLIKHSTVEISWFKLSSYNLTFLIKQQQNLQSYIDVNFCNAPR